MFNQKVMREFYEFGSRMQVIGILSVLSFILPFVGLIELIFIFLALGNIKRIYYEMPNARLMEFRSKYIISFIVGLFGLIIVIVSALYMVFTLIFAFYMNSYRNIYLLPMIMPMIIGLLIGIIILFISGIIEFKAWDSLSKFLEENRENFPELIAMEAIKGSNNLKYSVILSMTLILAIVGVILRIIGYFRLASLKKLYDVHGRPAIVKPQIVAPMVQVQQQSAIYQAPSKIGSFCPQCGSKLEREANFCFMCGNSLNK